MVLVIFLVTVIYYGWWQNYFFAELGAGTEHFDSQYFGKVKTVACRCGTVPYQNLHHISNADFDGEYITIGGVDDFQTSREKLL